MVKFGAKWVTDYPAPTPDLVNADDQAGGFCRKMTELGAGSALFKNANAAVSALQFEQSGVGPSGQTAGSDSLTNGVELVDLVYYSGHGSSSGIEIHDSTDSGVSRVSSTISLNELRWGQNLLKWVVLDACECLSSSNTGSAFGTDTKARWKPVFQGVHQILGFCSQASDEPFRGEDFATMLMPPYKFSILDAWELAVESSDDLANWAHLRKVGTESDIWGAPTPKPTASAAVELRVRMPL